MFFCKIRICILFFYKIRIHIYIFSKNRFVYIYIYTLKKYTIGISYMKSIYKYIFWQFFLKLFVSRGNLIYHLDYEFWLQGLRLPCRWSKRRKGCYLKLDSFQNRRLKWSWCGLHLTKPNYNWVNIFPNRHLSTKSMYPSILHDVFH